jgi:hypothetical protein
MSVAEVQLEKERLVKLIKVSLSWSESILRSFSEGNLQSIYNQLINRKKVYKTKVSSTAYEVRLYLPKELRTANGFTYGDRFNVKVNLHKKEVYLDYAKEGRYKLQNQGCLMLPYALVEKKVLKPSDDALLTYDEGRITVKSFSFMQE